MMKKSCPLPARENARRTSRVRAFTLLEVALIVAIIGMMLLMIIGYIFAPHKPDVLPPVDPPTLIPPSSDYTTPAPRKASTPVPATPTTSFTAPAHVPAPTPVAATPAPVAATPAPPAATPVPTQTIDLSPQGVPVFR